jgi:hypothetical protein
VFGKPLTCSWIVIDRVGFQVDFNQLDNAGGEVASLEVPQQEEDELFGRFKDHLGDDEVRNVEFQGKMNGLMYED